MKQKQKRQESIKTKELYKSLTITKEFFEKFYKDMSGELYEAVYSDISETIIKELKEIMQGCVVVNKGDLPIKLERLLKRKDLTEKEREVFERIARY